MTPLPVNTALSALTAAQIMELQRLLQRLGYDPGPVDGVMGPLTRGAYTRFAQANGHSFPRSEAVILPVVVQLQDAANFPEVWAAAVHGKEWSPPAPQPAATPTSTGPDIATPSGPYQLQSASSSSTYQTPARHLTEAEIRRKYGPWAFYLDHPEVGPILWEAAEGDYTQAELEGRIAQTGWWRVTQESARRWDNLWVVDPATAEVQLGRKTVEIYNAAARNGVPMREVDARFIAGRYLREGWSDEILMRFLGMQVRTHGFTQGKISEEAAKITELAQTFMVPLTDTNIQEYATQIFEGTATRDKVTSLLRMQAAGRFYWLADQINAGFTPTQLFTPIRNAVATQLEMAPESINFSDPRWSGLVDPITDATSKTPRSMTTREAISWARHRPEWRMTRNANEEASNLEMYILRTMGLVK